MLAATDPISVVALFKEFTVSKRLGIIVEGESLINDGIAVVLFAVVVKITAAHLGLKLPHFGDATEVQALAALLDFLREVLLGTAIGLGVGLAISYLTSKFDDQHIEVALTVIAAYGANVAAMELHASGVIAVVVCGMMIGNVGVKHGMSPTTREEVVSFWEFAAFMANSFVFILIGLEIQLGGLWANAGGIVLFFVIMILVRAITVFGVHGLVRREGLRLKREWLPVITWSGVRGSLSMVLVMMLVWVGTGSADSQAASDANQSAAPIAVDANQTAPVVERVDEQTANANKDKLLNLVYGVVLMSILLREETEYEMALTRRQAIRAMLTNLEAAEAKGGMSNETYRILHEGLLERREANDRRLAEMLEATPSLNAIELEMEASHLRALEKQVYRDLEKEGDLDYESMESLVRDVVKKPKE